MAQNWRMHKALAYIVLGLTVVGLLDLGLFNLNEKLFNFVDWKIVLVAGQLYVAWVFNKLLNF